MCCYIDDEFCEDVEVKIESKYDFGHIIYKDGETYKLKGLGGSGVHSFTKVGGAGMIYLREDEIDLLSEVPNHEENLYESVKVVEECSSYFIASINRIDAPPMMLSIVNEHRVNFFSLLNKHKDLIQQDIQTDLFSSESIMDKIPVEWIMTEKSKELESKLNEIINMDGEGLTKLFLDMFIEYKYPTWLEGGRYFEQDTMARIFSNKTMSDRDILYAIEFHCLESIETENRIRITISRISFLGGLSFSKSDIYLHNKGIDYKRIIRAIREKYNVTNIDNSTLEDAIKSSGINHLRYSFGDALSELDYVGFAKSSDSLKKFKSKLKSFADENNIDLSRSDRSDGGFSGFTFSGYSVSGSYGFNNGEFSLYERGLVLAYEKQKRGERITPEDNVFDRKIMSCKDSNMWEKIYHSLKAQ